MGFLFFPGSCLWLVSRSYFESSTISRFYISYFSLIMFSLPSSESPDMSFISSFASSRLFVLVFLFDSSSSLYLNSWISTSSFYFISVDGKLYRSDGLESLKFFEGFCFAFVGSKDPSSIGDIPYDSSNESRIWLLLLNSIKLAGIS